MRGFADLGDLEEDERINRIGMVAMLPPDPGEPPRVTGFIVEDQAKANRYIEKLKKKFPRIHVKDIGRGPTANTILVRIEAAQA